ncbi:MAG: Uncharacterised protein [Prochlorococcus marinus str. MIT 9215]|nr:MAG: Uncharacterised protein [Prochlorococcus marinus str. MIT 9215]
MDQEWVGDGLADSHLWIEAGQRVLEHHLDTAPGLSQ